MRRTLAQYQGKMGWRLVSGWVDKQLVWANNPHPCVVMRQSNMDYWNFNAGYGAGSLIYYDIRVRRAYKRQDREYPWGRG